MDENTKFIAINGSILTSVLSLIVFPDVLFGLFFQLLHFLLEFTHILFEFVESTLDHLIEHLFHTDLHQTQVIVFYIIVAIATTGIYGLWRTVPRACVRTRNRLLDFWVWEKSTAYLCWLKLTVTQKVWMVTILAMSFYLGSFLFF